MNNIELQTNQVKSVELPAPTASPFFCAAGVTLGLASLVTHPLVGFVGIVLAICAGVYWCFQTLIGHGVHIQSPVVPGPEPVTAKPIAVEDQLVPGHIDHRSHLPHEIHSYASGIIGGLAGGLSMGIFAIIYGLITHNSIWYTINLVAASVMASLSSADVHTLTQFNLKVFLTASGIHIVLSVAMGLIYVAMLPMMSRIPLITGAIILPLIWSLLVWTTLSIIDPLLQDNIHWPWYLGTQIVFGLITALIVMRGAKKKTQQTCTIQTEQ